MLKELRYRGFNKKEPENWKLCKTLLLCFRKGKFLRKNRLRKSFKIKFCRKGDNNVQIFHASPAPSGTSAQKLPNCAHKIVLNA
jgi:hypothetical protein